MIELLVAITILTIVVAIVYESFASVARSSGLAREAAAELRFRQFLWRNFTWNLTAVYSDAGCEIPEFQFVGTDEDGPYGPADTLRFCTSHSLPGTKSLPGVRKVVAYELTDPSQADSGFAIDAELEEERLELVLVITETPLEIESAGLGEEPSDYDAQTDFALDDESDEAASRQTEVPVRNVDIRYYDIEQEDWVEEWDSVEMLRLPWAVHIRANFARTEEELESEAYEGIDSQEDPDLDLTIALPLGAGVIGPFIDWNHGKSSGFLVDEVQESGEAEAASGRDS